MEKIKLTKTIITDNIEDDKIDKIENKNKTNKTKKDTKRQGNTITPKESKGVARMTRFITPLSVHLFRACE